MTVSCHLGYRLSALQKSGMYELYGSSNYSTQEVHGIFLLVLVKSLRLVTGSNDHCIKF